jgi:hypothetical protein
MDNNPGWRVVFRMVKHDGMPATDTTPVMPVSFDYVLALLPPPGDAAPTGAEVEILTGNFTSTGALRQGKGRLTVTLAEARTAGIALKDLDNVLLIDIEYDNTSWPRQMRIKVESVMPPDPLLPPPTMEDIRMASYLYTRTEDGTSQIEFTFTAEIFPNGPGGPETVTIHSKWLATGEGRSTKSVMGGDVTGVVTSEECWDRTFVHTYGSDWVDTDGDLASCIP